MNRLIDRRRATVRPARTRASRPRVEGLEDRLLLFATSGAEWALPSRVTYSFVPDGTSMGGTPSSLFSTLNAYEPTATWEAAIEKAAILWADVAHVNVVQVSDDGTAVGSEPDQQGDPTVGDIRIGAIPEPSGELAFTFMPPPLNGGSAAGDIFFNSTTNWGTYGYDLETVAIHEFGHALGLDHSALTNAVMYAYYNGTKQALTSDDVSGIQAIYGAPTDPNNDINQATAIPVTLNASGQATITGLDLSSSTDVNWFSVVVPSNTTGTLTLQIQSTGLSSFEPRITLYSTTQGLAQASSTTLGGGTATLTWSGVTPGQTYYFRGSAASATLGDTGAYGILVNFGSGSMTPIAPPNTTILDQASQGGGSQQDSVSVGAVNGDGDALTVSPAMQRHMAARDKALQALQAHHEAELAHLAALHQAHHR